MSAARKITMDYETPLRLPTASTQPGQLTTYAYDAHGNLLKKTQCSTDDGGDYHRCDSDDTLTTQSYTYNAAGQQLTATDAKGGVAKFSYDSQGNNAGLSNPLGQANSRTSDVNGKPLTMTDPDGVTTTNVYDSQGRLASTTTNGLTTAYVRDFSGNLIKVTKPDGSVTINTYDQANRLVAVADALGNKTVYTLDAAGHQIKTDMYDAAGNLVQTHSRVYDSLGRLVQDIGAKGQTAVSAYDANGNPLTTINPLGAVTSNAYDAQNHKIQTTDALGGKTLFAYDANGRVTSQTDPLGRSTTYAYDGLGHLLKTVSPDAGTTTGAYDAAGNLLTAADARGEVTTNAYDALNRKVKTAYADGSSVTRIYDQGPNAVGHVSSIADATGSLAYSYDANGHVIAKTQVTGPDTLNIAYIYDSFGRLAGATYPSGLKITYTFDADGRISGVFANGQPLATNVAYQAGSGSATGWTFAKGETYARPRDTDGRVAAISLHLEPSEPNESFTRTLTYDAGGRIAAMSAAGSQPAKSFNYDVLDRVTNYASGPQTQNFGYDANGNRTAFSQTQPISVSLSYAYDPASNRLASISGSSSESFVYDADGNIVSHTTLAASYAFVFDAKNRLAQASVGALKTSYGVNGLGQRVSKSDASGNVRVFVYDEAAHLIGEYDGKGNAIQETVWLGDMPVAKISASGTLYVAADYLNSPLVLVAGTGGEGQISWLWDHAPFGEDQPLAKASVSYNLRFPGQYYDSETGLHQNAARDYAPIIGRYIESDPIGLKGGNNSYAYARNNPLTFDDPSGLDATNWTNSSSGRSYLTNGPTNGNWGGKCWGGGQYTCDDVALVPAPPTDSADALYMQHDHCYDGIPTGQTNRTDCDATLVSGLKALPQDMSQWPQPPAPGTENDTTSYKNYAITYFGG